jgi:hypothetical protein
MLDIGKSVSQPTQTGKGRDDAEQDMMDDLQEEISETTPTTEPTVLKGAADMYTELIQNILDKTPNISITNVNIQDLMKSQAYKKLKVKHKEYVDNKIQDLLPLDKKKITVDAVDKTGEDMIAYLLCKNCGYASKINPGTKIFSRASEDIAQSYDVTDYSDLLNSDILPRTRKYVCPNKQCESHKDGTKREAVFFRLNNTYKIKHICCTCKTVF